MDGGNHTALDYDQWAGFDFTNDEGTTITVPDSPVGITDAEEAARIRTRAAVNDRLRHLRVDQEARRLLLEENAARAKAEAANQTRVCDGASFLLDLPEAPPAVWGDGDDVLWMEGEALIIAGPQGVGKTTLAGQLLAGSLGLRDQVLGYTIKPTKGKVLYLAMDRPKQAARNLARIFRHAPRELLAEKLAVWQGPPPADFAVSPETLLDMCRLHDATVVFVDSVKDAAVGLAKDEVGAGYNRARQLAIAEGIEVVELHHQRKAGENGAKPTTANDVYGSVHLTNGAGSIVLLWGQPGDPLVEFIHLKQPVNTVGPFDIEHDQQTGLSTVRRDESKDLVGLARRCTSGLSAKDAATVLFDELSPDKGQVAKARRELSNLTKKGLLVAQEPDGSGRGAQTLWFAAAHPSDAAREPVPAAPCGWCGLGKESVEHTVLCLWTGMGAAEVATGVGLPLDRVEAIRAAHAARKPA
ncbi:AAA family ATPase [Micromonospora zamorensis]|uniref:AAA family ATPase n=1 Tax=Micromonospora zamorensis TaxID=709883 RepID=UPI003788AAF6